MMESELPTTEPVAGPLSGIKVLDMTVAVQGPHAAAYLADMGADVVKVEAPGGELNRYYRGSDFPFGMEVMGSQYACMNRGKRGICLDVHTELGREVLHRLAARSDVFVSNYRAEALVRMGMGYEELAALNPRLVWARASGFGDLGPEAEKAMLDGAAQARGGLAAVSGPADGPPMPPGAAIADHGGAMQLSLGIMTALYAREHTGRGQQVNTSSLGAIMWLQSWEIGHTAMSGRPIRRRGTHHPSILGPYGVYETKDGGAFLFAVAMSDEAWDEFWVVVGQPEVVLDERWNTAAKRIGARGSEDGVTEVRQQMREAFASQTTAEWTEFLAAQPEIIYERIQGYDDLLGDAQVAANEYLARVEVPGYGPTPMVSNVVHLSATPGPGVRRPPPRLGEHTAEVMAELGFSSSEITAVVDRVARAADTVIKQVTGG
jgi:formyl-CoA transferase